MYYSLFHCLGRRWRKCRRGFGPIFSLLLLTLPSGGVSRSLDESQSLSLGLGRDDFQQLLESRLEAARGDVTRTETWINPEFELSREELGEETEIDLWISQRLDLSGRREWRRVAARSSLQAVSAQLQESRRSRIAKIRRQFYQTLYQQRVHEVYEHWVDKFEALEAAMYKREASGDVSGYDRRRITREKISLVSRQRESHADYAAAWAELIGMLKVDDGELGFERVQGDLVPHAPPPLEQVLSALGQLPALQSLQHQAEAKQSSSRALARGHIPDLVLGVGRKWLEGPAQTEQGMMLSASVELPLFDRRQGEYQRARAESQALESEYRLTRSRLQAQLQGLWRQALALSENARAFRRQSVSASQELVRIAETAYRNNELGVLELIDAYRSALASEQDALELALQARLKRIELDRLAGGVLP